MYKLNLEKEDGRNLFLYSREPFKTRPEAPSPKGIKYEGRPHLRWHPLRGEWVSYASFRENRTFLPPPQYNPLAPTKDLHQPTELPPGDYDIAVFDNLFPSLSLKSDPPTGHCEVVVFTQDPKSSLGALPLSHIELLIDVWSERYEEIGKRPEIKYVMPFENRGIEMGVTLNHPHGQIYSYTVIPPIPKKELEEQKKYLNENGRGLLEDMIQTELREKQRLIVDAKTVVAFAPPCARYPYEVWIAPKKARAALNAMTSEEKKDFALVLKTVLLKFDHLWKRPFPYLMVFHQAPTDGEDHLEAHIHVEFYPPYRSQQKLKYLAGTELGAGLFANDSLPEDKAAELRRVEVTIDSY